MQNTLKLEYHPSHYYIVSYFLVFLLVIASFFLLNLALIYRCGLTLATMVYFFYKLAEYRQKKCDELHFDGNNWHSYHRHDNKKQKLELQKELFISRYLLVLEFECVGSKERMRCYFAADNCSQKDFRHLCCHVRC